MAVIELENRQIVVVGLGRSGVATARFLARRGARVTVTDLAPAHLLQKAIDQLAPWPVQFALGGHRVRDFETADLVVLSPGVPHRQPMLEPAWSRGIPVIGEIELAAGYIAEPMLAVTGTNGKTTTTQLIGEMLTRSGRRVFVGGNIGTPLIAYADGVHGQADLVVAEISSFQLDTMVDFHPRVAVMLNLADDHLDRYDGFGAYAAAKWRIFRNQGPTDVAVINADDPAVTAMARHHPPAARLLRYSHGEVVDGARIHPDRIQRMVQGRAAIDWRLDKTGLTGPHNRENMAAACVAAGELGATPAGIQAAIDASRGLPHRMEPVGTVGGVRFVNDSKATNVDAVRRALTCFAEPVVLIMGGQNKKGDFTQLRSLVRQQVKTLVVLGQAREEIVAALSGAPQGGIRVADSLEAAVQTAFEEAGEAGTVLLSPACASFDMFDSYVHRGLRFRQIVEGLA